ncbi:MAG: type I restriction enzyme HsdR N-terminal domain-containing protein [Planctomycetes bacterium]|nr:type I restriction enzyme HsdR N-terminal domain-containing protein [Planctomycetota bacterium]
MTDNAVIGIAECDSCSARFKIREKQRYLQGKSIRCPKCHSLFRVNLSEPSFVEEAALKNDEEEEKKANKRRSKNEIRQEYIDQVKTGFRELHGRLSEINDNQKSSEEQVRVWCIDALRNALGYANNQIDTELRALGKSVDIAIKNNDKVFMIIECKNIRSKLNGTVLNQAALYASTLTADWAVITNGQIWKLYRVFPQKGMDPKIIEVFDVALLDDDGVSDKDAEDLYLLTHRAISSGDTEKNYHQTASTTQKRLIKVMKSEKVIKAIRQELISNYKEDTGENIKLDDDDIGEKVGALFEPLDLQ